MSTIWYYNAKNRWQKNILSLFFLLMKSPPMILNLGFEFMDMFSKISNECFFC